MRLAPRNVATFDGLPLAGVLFRDRAAFLASFKDAVIDIKPSLINGRVGNISAPFHVLGVMFPVHVLALLSLKLPIREDVTKLAAYLSPEIGVWISKVLFAALGPIGLGLDSVLRWLRDVAQVLPMIVFHREILK